MCDTESPLCHFLYYGDDILKATGGDHMLPYNNKVAEKRKERKEKPKKQAERARELQKERMKKKGKW
jgi:hypothetical protein